MLAQPGQLYEGPIIVQSKGYLVQKVGRTGVLHDLARFTTIPPLNENLQIAYALDGGMARVGAAPAPEKSKGPER